MLGMAVNASQRFYWYYLGGLLGCVERDYMHGIIVITVFIFCVGFNRILNVYE